MSSGTAALAAFFAMSLFISSTLITEIIFDARNVKLMGYNPEITRNIIQPSQDFTDINTFNESILEYSFLGSPWIINENIGLISQGDGAVLFKNVQKIGNNYEVIYNINNSVHSDFTIYVLASTNRLYEIRLVFDSIGITIPNNIIPLLYDYQYLYPDINKIDRLAIKTIYNPDEKTLEVDMNNMKLFSTSVHDTIGLFASLGGAWYGGLNSNSGLTLQLLETPIAPNQINIFTMILDYIQIFISLVFYTVDEAYLPLFLNLLLIKSQLIGLIASILAYGRGV